MIPLSLTSTLFPYTTLFRSRVQDGGVSAALLRRGRVRGGGDAGDGVPRVHAEDRGVRGADQAAVHPRRVELRRAAEDRDAAVGAGRADDDGRERAGTAPEQRE